MAKRDELNSLLSNPALVRELGPGFFTALTEEDGAAPYDRRAIMYDAALQWSIYHRVAWGTSARAYAQFGSVALESAGRGCFADIGCGSLLFTAQMYRHVGTVSALLVDRSVQMLRRAVKRLGGETEGLPTGVVALHADGGRLPFRSAIFSSILGLNLLHVPCDRKALVAECRRTLVPGHGRLFVSSLVRSGRWSDGYLALLHRAGECGTPLTRESLGEMVAEGWGKIESLRVEGNMSYLVVRHAG